MKNVEKLADSGRRWKKMEEDGRRWKKLIEKKVEKIYKNCFF